MNDIKPEFETAMQMLEAAALLKAGGGGDGEACCKDLPEWLPRFAEAAERDGCAAEQWHQYAVGAGCGIKASVDDRWEVLGEAPSALREFIKATWPQTPDVKELTRQANEAGCRPHWLQDYVAWRANVVECLNEHAPEAVKLTEELVWAVFVSAKRSGCVLRANGPVYLGNRSKSAKRPGAGIPSSPEVTPQDTFWSLECQELREHVAGLALGLRGDPAGAPCWARLDELWPAPDQPPRESIKQLKAAAHTGGAADVQTGELVRLLKETVHRHAEAPDHRRRIVGKGLHFPPGAVFELARHWNELAGALAEFAPEQCHPVPPGLMALVFACGRAHGCPRRMLDLMLDGMKDRDKARSSTEPVREDLRSLVVGIGNGLAARELHERWEPPWNAWPWKRAGDELATLLGEEPKRGLNDLLEASRHEELAPHRLPRAAVILRQLAAQGPDGNLVKRWSPPHLGEVPREVMISLAIRAAKEDCPDAVLTEFVVLQGAGGMVQAKRAENSNWANRWDGAYARMCETASMIATECLHFFHDTWSMTGSGEALRKWVEGKKRATSPAPGSGGREGKSTPSQHAKALAKHVEAYFPSPQKVYSYDQQKLLQRLGLLDFRAVEKSPLDRLREIWEQLKEVQSTPPTGCFDGRLGGRLQNNLRSLERCFEGALAACPLPPTSVVIGYGLVAAPTSQYLAGRCDCCQPVIAARMSKAQGEADGKAMGRRELTELQVRQRLLSCHWKHSVLQWRPWHYDADAEAKQNDSPSLHHFIQALKGPVGERTGGSGTGMSVRAEEFVKAMLYPVFRDEVNLRHLHAVVGWACPHHSKTGKGGTPKSYHPHQDVTRETCAACEKDGRKTVFDRREHLWRLEENVLAIDGGEDRGCRYEMWDFKKVRCRKTGCGFFDQENVIQTRDPRAEEIMGYDPAMCPRCNTPAGGGVRLKAWIKITSANQESIMGDDSFEGNLDEPFEEEADDNA